MTTYTTPTVTIRHPLGLPAGSVRAILVFIVLLLVWLMMVLPLDRAPTIPLYLYYLMFLSLGSFFAAHGHTIGHAAGSASPLYLPRGSLRFLIVLGFAAVLGWKFYTTRDWHAVLQEIKPPDMARDQAYLPLVLLGAFFAGILLSRLFGRSVAGVRVAPPWFQDILAWLAVLATIGMGALAIIYGFINPGLPEGRQIQVGHFEMFLGAVTGLYFGARS